MTETGSPTYGVRSMSAPLRRVLVVRPTTTGDWTGAGRRTPDTEALLREHEAFVELLTGLGVDVVLADAPEGMVDACFAYDPVFVTGSGAVRLQMAKPARQDEPAFLATQVEKAGVPVIGQLTGVATADGGDMCWLDERTLAVGRGYRTNAEGIAQLRAILAPRGVDVLAVDLPHWRGPADVFHLMSMISPVDRDLAVVYSPLLPVPFREALLERGTTLVEVPDDEFETMGANVLAIAPRRCVMVAGNPVTRDRLERAGAEVVEYDGSEISLKGGGGPTCLTRPLRRSDT